MTEKYSVIFILDEEKLGVAMNILLKFVPPESVSGFVQEGILIVRVAVMDVHDAQNIKSVLEGHPSLFIGPHIPGHDGNIYYICLRGDRRDHTVPPDFFVKNSLLA